MSVVRHADPTAFQAAVGRLLVDDPVRHTGVLGQLAFHPRHDSILLTAHHGNDLLGALVLMPPGVALTSALPLPAHDQVIDYLIRHDIHPSSAHGPRDVTDPFVERWCHRTGAIVTTAIPERLFRLAELIPPRVAGNSRVATSTDVPLVTRWNSDFLTEVGFPGSPNPRGSAAFVRAALAAGRAHHLWVVDDRPVSFALVSPPVVGMSRIGPVYTPPDLRGHGYASAATAAAARWARGRGARDVLLFADVDNRVANSIYTALGFVPVHDSVETGLAQPNTL
ncbi:GNAT family N-acetyltransferase [Actinokineospora spheciospongiae]|uniref:GNAT family N-acetyltransferase n=1 Tax=Actinokineospora spheciospongiae TaxID=909613 RepID=UPI000D711453|nr:GNAT family N-acetyltransferase [Actinokineospora spheciospongiae]PWW53621.1 putative GNAT family acetyltransferase [Actinokineospora spheciospongiae]